MTRRPRTPPSRDSAAWTRPLTYVWLPLALLAAWQGLSAVGVLNPLFLPPPTAVAARFARMLASGDLQHAVLETTVLAAAGYGLGSLAGIALGLLMGALPFVRRSLDPLLAALWASPKLTLFPMLMLLLGIGAAPRIVLVAIGAFLLVALATADAVRGVPANLIEVARNYGASGSVLVRKVYLPAAAPGVFSGLRLAAGRSLTLTVAIELVSAERGLGGLIWLAWQSFTADRLYVGVFTTSALGLLLHFLLHRLERIAIPWREGA